MDGASVMISSRKQENVQQAMEKLKEENINVAGTVCDVSKQKDRAQLIQEVSIILCVTDYFGALVVAQSHYYLSITHISR